MYDKIFVPKLLIIIAMLTIFGKSCAAVLTCPPQCHCAFDSLNVAVDCSGLELTELPEFDDYTVHILDLSNNKFTQIPWEIQNFGALQYLDLSGNQLSKLKPDSLKGLSSLRHLDLSRNNFSSWSSMSPRYLLEPTINLVELNLAENHFTSFSSNDENLLLISSSLRWLDLSNCKIVKVAGEQVIQGMKKLESITFSGNPIRSISSLVSNTLGSLDLSNCQLTTLQPTVFENLINLESVNLSRNHRLSLVSKKQTDFVRSETVRTIDLSYCNMDAIELDGFPDLNTAILRGNMIQKLTHENFGFNENLENLDLSFNSIKSIKSNTFKHLKFLKKLDLSFNMIPKIERETFKENYDLTDLDLSRNYVGRFNRITAPSLTFLNMSWCEILTVDSDALFGMPKLLELDLSSNLISEIPILVSNTLQTLDLSTCRISSIQNTTFANFPELARINLSGNRFTTAFKANYFEHNTFLSEIWLGDNPWRCDCHDSSFFNFYSFLVEAPSRLWDRSALKCMSPENVAGRTWESACHFIWYPQSSMGKTEKVWTFFLVTIVVFFGSMCVLMAVKKAIEGRQRTQREREREQMMEEHRDITRQNQMRMQQEAQLNAPDPRESHPPCYEDALRMPRLDRNFVSMSDLTSRAKKRKKSATQTDTIEEVQLRRNRCRSEEVLSMRETVTSNGSILSPNLPPRSHPFEVESPPGSPIQQPSNILNLSHSPGRARARSANPNRVNTQIPANGSIEEIRDFNKSNATISKGSPYPNRTLRQQKDQDTAGPSTASSAVRHQENRNDEIEVIDDHFGRSRGSLESDTGDFVELSAKDAERSSLISKNEEEFEVIVHQPPRNNSVS